MDLFSRNIDDINNQNRQVAKKRKIVALLNRSEEDLTIPAICKKVKLSIPTGTKLINELIDDKIIVESGKKETDNGRRPALYRIDPEYAYSIGLVILLKGLSLSVYNLEMDEVYSITDDSFVLENSTECLEKVVAFIQTAVDKSKVNQQRILGMGIGITGRVNARTGYSYNYFNFLDGSLVDFFTEKFVFPVYVDNDTHVLGLAEQYFGKAKNIQNAFVLNLSGGLGMAIISNGEIIGGEQGFAGEFGHIQLGDSNRLCLCGKRGCVGTEVGGHALERNFHEHIEKNETSLLLTKKEEEKIDYLDILRAASKGDALSISITHNMGFKLGKALGNVLNLLNPGVIIVGGKFAPADAILMDSIKAGMLHTALSLPLRSCELTFSSIGSDAAIKGAGALVLSRMQLI
ncbi:ROK family protein [Mariniphaga anaerophila]|uniref:ROK family protein n=1 Tax=Mariniphaga anaerophila TaxID=1484053 RepID=UPI000933FECB|nr:ROK family protein [Mariniphaga anaerophila]